jgi:vitamin K-dependent gamma-carboxylase
MKLRDKDADVRFQIVGADGRRSFVDPARFLTSWQYEEMSTRPDMILQFARHVKEARKPPGAGDIEVHAQVAASLNGRDEQPLIDPEIDLTDIQLQGLLGHADWIVPLRTPLN